MAAASIASDIGDLESTVDLVAIAAILGLLIYVVYKFPDWWDQILTEIGADVHAPIQAIKDVFQGKPDIGGYDTPSDTKVGIPSTSTSGTGETTATQGCFVCDGGQVLAGNCDQAQLGQNVCQDTEY